MATGSPFHHPRHNARAAPVLPNTMDWVGLSHTVAPDRLSGTSDLPRGQPSPAPFSMVESQLLQAFRSR